MSELFSSDEVTEKIDYIAEARAKRKKGQVIFRDNTIDNILNQAEAYRAEVERLTAERDALLNICKDVEFGIRFMQDDAYQYHFSSDNGRAFVRNLKDTIAKIEQQQDGA